MSRLPIDSNHVSQLQVAMELRTISNTFCEYLPSSSLQSFFKGQEALLIVSFFSACDHHVDFERCSTFIFLAIDSPLF